MSTGNANGFENGTPSVTVAIPSAMPNVPFSHIDKTEKFKGVDFKPWQKKMYFYLTTLNLARFLSEDAPIIAENDTNKMSGLHLMHGSTLISCVGTMC